MTRPPPIYDTFCDFVRSHLDHDLISDHTTDTVHVVRCLTCRRTYSIRWR